ncbi:MAG TPA: NAD(P)/FAD-dependent oxidoreductase [Terriglobales bacterium]|nr:NAD(P)/FAD-dependent oxidoreductase [Terriglobales bacterium]
MSNDYDLIVVGSGISGSALARSMAADGARVLVLEAETEFKDRVRGEVLVPWGVAEAMALGVDDALDAAGAQGLRWLNQYMGPQQIERRDFPATTSTRTLLKTFYHPRMQTALLETARAKGADIRQGVLVAQVESGTPLRVRYTKEGHPQAEDLTTRFVVVSDGRNSRFRRLPGFDVRCESHTLCIAGVLLEQTSVPEDAFHMFTNPACGEITVFAPQGGGRARVYLCFWKEMKPRFQGSADFTRLLGDLEWTGVSQEYFRGATQAGPLATFEGADTWVQHPYANGIALLGDAAASSDPAWGQGLSLALRGARSLRDALRRNSNWHVAGDEYAQEQGCFYTKVRTIAGWFRELFLEQGAAADARRARALPLIAQDSTRVPDLLFSGPDIPIPADAQSRFYGLDRLAAASA